LPIRLSMHGLLTKTLPSLSVKQKFIFVVQLDPVNPTRQSHVLPALHSPPFKHLGLQRLCIWMAF
jgi:hypothetical protein